MDVRYINPFLSSIKNVFETMLGMPFNLGKPHIKPDQTPLYDVSAFIGLTGGVTGCVVLCLSEPMALTMASALCGSNLKEIGPDATDAIGEIANMIAGNAKKDFPEGNNLISVPTVVQGRHKVKYPRGLPIISIPCETSVGRLIVDVALRTEKKAAAAAVAAAGASLGYR